MSKSIVSWNLSSERNRHIKLIERFHEEEQVGVVSHEHLQRGVDLFEFYVQESNDADLPH